MRGKTNKNPKKPRELREKMDKTVLKDFKAVVKGYGGITKFSIHSNISRVEIYNVLTTGYATRSIQRAISRTIGKLQAA